MDRKAELERKKARLAAMKEERERKKREIEQNKKGEPSDGAPAAGSQTQGSVLRQQTEDLLKDLGIPDAPASAAVSGGAQAQPRAQPKVTEVGDVVIPTQRLAKRTIELTTSKVTQTSIPPRENVTYSKETQTIVEQYDREEHFGSRRFHKSGNSPRHYPPFGSPGNRFHVPNLEWDDEFSLESQDEDTDSMDVGVDTPPTSAVPHHGHHHKMPQVEMMKPAETAEDAASASKQEEKPPPELTEEEKEKIMMSENFNKFLEKSSRVIERMLSDRTDFFADYAGDEDKEKEGILGEGEKIKVNRQFYDERWSKHRSVTCMDWSAQYPELLVASYNNNEESVHDPDGVALVWNTKYKKSTPEYVFHCQSAVMSTCFAKFHPNLIVGGTYSGQIVLWDNRSSKRTPVQRTPLSAAAHTHPVYCVQVVGTQNAHNLISVSTDGKLCSWSLDMLSAPQDSMELQHKQSKAVAVTSMAFFSNDVNNYVVGSEEGAVYTGCRHGTKAGINEMFEGHQGPITGIHTNTVPGQIDFSPYFLSASFDWTVKLWNAKDTRPLHSFEDNADYIYDVKWSPIHPALFSTVDGMGRLDIWNLNNDIEVPTATTAVEGNVALNKCLWHQSGHNIAAADDVGKIHIFDVGETLANPKADEWTRFLQTLTEMKQNQTEREEERSVGFMSSPLR